MDIADIKRWQWVVVGILAGLALGYVWAGGEPAGSARKVSQLDFERDLTRKDPKSGQPILQKIVVHPPTKDYDGKRVQPVTFLKLFRSTKDGKVYRQWAQLIATVPYKPQFGPRGRAGATANPHTVADYLKAVAQQNKDVRYRYGWESVRPVSMAVCTVGAVVMIGGIWPSMLSLLIGAGLGGARDRKKKENYFDRFSHAPEPAKAARANVSQQERDRLAEMNRRLEQELAADGIGVAGTGAPDQSPADVRKLEGGALEVTPVGPKPEDDDEIEIKGVYYPVLIHHKKHHDEHPHDEPGHTKPKSGE